MMARRRILVALTAIAAWIAAVNLPFANHLRPDVELYQSVAHKMAAGQMPYRDFFLEYPPGAAVFFWVARLVPTPYATGVGILLCAALVVTTVAVMWAAQGLGFSARRQVAAGLLVALSPLLLGRYVIAERFDLILSATVALMIAFATRRRFGWAWSMLALAVFVKLVPVLLAPLLLLWQRRTRPQSLMRDVGVGAAFGVATFLPFLVLAPHGLWRMVHYHLVRPLQIESLGAAYLRGITSLAGHPMTATYSYGSHNLVGRGPSVISAITTVVQVGAIIAVLVTVWRMRSAGPRVYVSAIAATLAVIVATAKVLSPQYMLWLLPASVLVAGRYGRLAAALLAAALVVTQLGFPFRYLDLLAGDGFAIALIVVRDLLLIMLVAACWPRRDQIETLNERIPEASPSGAASITAP
jgi:hypothetical protein